MWVTSTCIPPSRGPLIGRLVRLDPITTDDIDPLHAIMSDPAAFGAGHPFERAHGSRLETEDFVAGRLAIDGLAYVVRAVSEVIDRPGTVCGTTSVTEIDTVNEKAHLGSTFYARRHLGGGVNPETKLLLLGHLFDDCGFGRVRIHCDSRNERSRAAIARLGARFEGVLRRDVRRADGSWRDTVVYAITGQDWPACRTALQERVRAEVAGRP